MLIQDIIPPVKKGIKPVEKIIRKQSRNKYASMILAFLLIFETLAGVFIPFKLSLKTPYVSFEETRAAGENWFSTGGTWNYRRQITLDPVTPEANYQVKVTLSSTTLTGAQLTSGNANGNDIRFTGSDGNTLKDYWIESWSATGTSVTATIWVKVITSGESTIYMYYGNSGASAGSNGSNTFEAFDDFEGGTPGQAPSGWTNSVITGYTAVGTVQVSSDVALSGTKSLKEVSSSQHSTLTKDGYTFTSGIIEVDYRTPDKTKAGRPGITYRYSNGSNFYNSLGTTEGGGWYHRKNVGTDLTTSTSFTFQSNIWHHLKAVANGSSLSISVDSTTLTATDASYASGSIGLLLGYLDTAYYDNFRIRKYAATEPVATAGAEEYFNYYTVTGTGSMDAGGSQVITITAKTNLGNTYNFSGDKSLTFSGPSASGGGNNPTCTDKTSAEVNFGTATTITLASGVGTCTMKLYKAESVSVDVTDGTVNSAGNTSYDLDVTVSSTLSGMSVQINSNDSYTALANTTLTLAATGASQMKFSNDNAAYSAYEAYGVSKAWDITDAAYGGTSSDGTKTVYVIFKDAYGNEAAAVNDNIVYDTTPPTNPTAAVDAQGAVTDTWQNNKSDPNFTSFTGESDTNGIANFYVYFGTDSAGVTIDSIATDAYDPVSFATSNTRYLRVIAKDNAGLWADPDGGGATCTNTNASRPVDADCWATIFIHKYDIDAPNTPSPVSSPVSWTATNSFDFSWVSPGDVGGSGVKDYTYQTDAGTGATTTASISVSGLTSNANGTKLFSVKANDNAGNSGTNGTVNFYYDNSAPTNAGAATDGNGSLDDTWGTVSDPNFTWVAGTDAGDQSGVKEYDVYWGINSGGTTVTATVGTNAYNPAAIPVNTPYYLRIRTRDNAGNVSAWATKFTMKYSQAASSPSGLSQTANAAALAFGDWTNDTTPTLNFTLSDPDSDTLGYVIKVDNNGDFSSPEVFYTYSANDLPSGAEYSFTVGQAAGTGAYTNGSGGQTLAEGEYYWKVKAIESHSLASSEAIVNGGLVAFGIDTSNPTGTTLGFGTIAADSVTATVSGAADAVSGLNTTPYYFENTTATTNSGWQAGTSWASNTLSPNTQYTFKVTSRDKAGNTQATATQNKYTLANTPSAPTVNNATPTTLDANVNVNFNPVSTEFAIYKETGATCDGSGGAYIAADGSDNGATAVWQTDALWGTTIATGLSESTEYSFCVKARNGDSTETSFGSAASGTTTVSNVAPDAPALVSPANASYTSDNTPTLSANYSDPDADDVGTTNYRVSSTNAADCNSNLNIVASGASSTTSINNEDTTWAPGSPIGSDGTYYWCAQNNDGSLTSSWTSMGNLILDTTAPTGTTLGFGTITVDSITATVSDAADSGAGLHATSYYFENTTAATNSGWQAGTSWASGSLTPNTQYTFKVKSKDTLGNESSFTTTESKYTLANVPSSLGLAADSGTQITASWNANSNPDGTQYYAENTTAGTNSGWVTATSWASSGLSCGLSYFLKVKTKNGDGTETAFTDVASASTVDCPAGGGLPPGMYNPPGAPPTTSQSPGGFSISINNGSQYTNSRLVILSLNGGPDAVSMAISEDSEFKYATLEPYSEIKNWVLSGGDGIKTVYVKFYTQWGQSSKPVSSSIFLDTKMPEKEIATSPLPSPSLSPSVSPEIPKIGMDEKEPISSEEPPVEVSPGPEPSSPPEPTPGVEISEPEQYKPVESVKPREPAKTADRNWELPSVNLDPIKESIISAFQKAGNLADSISGTAKNASGKIPQAVSQGFDGLKKGAGSAFGSAKAATVKVVRAANNGLAALFNNAKNTMMTFVDGIERMGRGAGDIIVEQFSPMQISNVKANPLSPTSVEITWETNHKGTSKVNWGLSRVYDQEKQDSTKVKNHSVILIGLKPGTTYHYEVISQNGSYAYDADRIFYTPEE